MDASAGLQSELMDLLTSMVSDVVIDDSTYMHNELKGSLAVICRISPKSLTPGGRDGKLLQGCRAR